MVFKGIEEASNDPAWSMKVVQKYFPVDKRWSKGFLPEVLFLMDWGF
jgi:hypothetical protein